MCPTLVRPYSRRTVPATKPRIQTLLASPVYKLVEDYAFNRDISMSAAVASLAELGLAHADSQQFLKPVTQADRDARAEGYRTDARTRREATIRKIENASREELVEHLKSLLTRDW